MIRWLAVLTSLCTLAAATPARADATSSSMASKLSPWLRADLRASFAVTDKRGAPDAIRLGATAGALVLRRGLFDLSADAAGVFGFSEKIGHSYRFGANVELDRRLPAIDSSAYVALGLHYFVSRAAEDRTGLLPRIAFGFRVLTSKHVYVGFEPLAVERIPAGEGIQTPVRTRWAWEMTFLSVGFRP